MSQEETTSGKGRPGHAAGLAGRVGAALVKRLGRSLDGPWPELVGVDLGGASVKVAHLVRRGGRVRSLRTARKALPPAEGRAVDRRELVARALGEAVIELGVTGRPAAVCVLGGEVFVRRLTLPQMGRSDIHQALLLECRKLVNFPIEEAELRYEIVGTNVKGNGSSELHLLVSAARRRRIEEARETLALAGLKPVAISIVPVALQSLLREVQVTNPQEVVAYLDMGASTTHILVLKGDEVRFSREFGVGGATLTDALREIVIRGRGTIELTADEAEGLKREHGIPLGPEEAEMAGSIPLSAVSIMLRPILERLVRELWNSFDYCNEQYLGEAVTRVVLLGEGSRVRNLPEHLTGVLKIPVLRADLPVEVLEESAKGAGRRDASLGRASELALGLAHLSKGALNFLAPANAGVPYRLADAVPQRMAAAAAVVLLISVALPSHVGLVKERQRIAAMRSQLHTLEPREDALQRFRAAREQETRAQELLARLSGGQVLWSFVLRDLSHRIGEDVRLTELSVAEAAPGAPAPAAGAADAAAAGRSVRLTGLLRTGSRRAEDVLSELMISLQQSPVLDQVRLEGCEAVNGSVSSFTVTARLAE
jgi:type IV pilus assembly protein PilM